MWPFDVPEGHIFAWGITCVVISPLIIAFNIILIVALVKTKDTSSFTSRYVICLSLSDIGMGSIAMPLLAIMLFVKDLQANCAYQKAVQCIAYSFGYTSFFMLTAIGVDRYLLIKKLIRYKTLMNNFRWRLIVATIVVLSIILSVISVSAYSFPLHFTFIFANIICIGSIYLLYVKLLYRIDKQAAALVNVSESTPGCKNAASKKSRRRRRKRDISVARTVRLLLGAIFLLYMPYNIISIIWTYYRFQKKINPGQALSVTLFWTYVLMFVNGIINVLIYGHGNSEVRRFLKSHTGLGKAEKYSSNSRTETESEPTKYCDGKKSNLLTSS